jgi:hypothetical protein
MNCVICYVSLNSSLGFGLVEYCNVFDFMIGLVFYNIPSDTPGAFNRTANMMASLELAFKYDDPKELSRKAYNASYAAAMYDEYTDPVWRKEAFSFCYSELYNATCSLILFNTYDDIAMTTSEYYYQVKEGACNDSFTVANEFWYVCPIFIINVANVIVIVIVIVISIIIIIDATK